MEDDFFMRQLQGILEQMRSNEGLGLGTHCDIEIMLQDGLIVLVVCESLIG